MVLAAVQRPGSLERLLPSSTTESGRNAVSCSGAHRAPGPGGEPSRHAGRDRHAPVRDGHRGRRPSAGPATPIDAPVANPSRFPINLAPGRHVIGVHATFQGMGANGVEYEFEVVVRTTGTLLTLTG